MLNDARRINDQGYTTVGRLEFMSTLSPFFTPEEMAQIEAAYFFSKNAHSEQLRDDGNRYFEHPKTVAWLLADHFGIHDWRTIVMALLHDMLEDSYIMVPDRIKKNFGKKVMRGVVVLSKNSFENTIRYDLNDANAAYYRRFETDGTWRETMVKLVDRIHNLSTMNDMDTERVSRKLAETEKYFHGLQGLLLTTVPDRHYGQAEAICQALEEAIENRMLWLSFYASQ